MADKTWKAFERQIAKILGGRRVPITGRQRGDVPDVEHDYFSIECKLRKSVPKWIKSALAQAHAASRGRKRPVVFLREKGSPESDIIVIMYLNVLTELYSNSISRFER